MDVVGLVGRGAEPEVVVEFFWDRLGFEVGETAPEELPSESGGFAYGDFEGPAEHAAVDDLLDFVDWNAHAVEIAVDAEPGV